MNSRERKTAGFKPILVSPEIHARLAEITKKSEVYNDVISKLLSQNSLGVKAKNGRSPSK